MNWKRKTVLIPGALAIYTIIVAILFIPNQSAEERGSSYLTLAGSLVLIVILFFILRKQEQIRERNRQDREKREQA